MTQLKEELNYKINSISDDRLMALKPLIDMLYKDTIFIERVNFDDLEEDEKEAVTRGRIEYKNGECIDYEDYLMERNSQ